MSETTNETITQPTSEPSTGPDSDDSRESGSRAEVHEADVSTQTAAPGTEASTDQGDQAEQGSRTAPGAIPWRTPRTPPATRRAPRVASALEQEGEIAADYLEELLEIADLDGDLDMDVEGDRATVSIVGADLPQLVGEQRRGARGAAGADPAGGLPRDR